MDSKLATITGLGIGLAVGLLTRGRGLQRIRNVIRGRVSLSKVRSFIVSTSDRSKLSNSARGYKLAIIVRQDLKMSGGKTASQCAHAAVLAYLNVSRKDPKTLQRWLQCGQPKVVLKCDSESTLLQLSEKAERMGLVTSLVADAGLTQIATGSKTTLGIGPARVDQVNSVTGHLKLL